MFQAISPATTSLSKPNLKQAQPLRFGQETPEKVPTEAEAKIIAEGRMQGTLMGGFFLAAAMGILLGLEGGRAYFAHHHQAKLQQLQTRNQELKAALNQLKDPKLPE